MRSDGRWPRTVLLHVMPTSTCFRILRALRATTFALLLASLAACADSTSPGDDAIRFVVDERIGATPSSVSGGGYATAAAGQGVIVVLGRIAVPSSCHMLSAQVQRTGMDFVATIKASIPLVTCPASAVTRDYSLRIAELSAGTYRIRVLHAVEGESTAPMLDREVQVQ